MTEKNFITVTVILKTTLEKAWEFFTNPAHVVKWYFASNDWHAPSSTNDLIVGGKFSTRMESKDGSMGFNFSGTYTEVELNKLLKIVLDDERLMNVNFTAEDEIVTIMEQFEPEYENDIDLQKNGWQAILNNFKKYIENN
jgi:uncharacterized protein YndB with AHSA1/START domain